MAHILLIEDDDPYRIMLAKVLRDAGYAVTEARDGRDGVRSFRARPADVVITDIIMPEQEGLETVRQLKALRPGLSIIAISGAGAEAPLYLSMAEKLGARFVLLKPFKPEELIVRVRELSPP